MSRRLGWGGGRRASSAFLPPFLSSHVFTFKKKKKKEREKHSVGGVSPQGRKGQEKKVVYTHTHTHKKKDSPPHRQAGGDTQKTKKKKRSLGSYFLGRPCCLCSDSTMLEFSFFPPLIFIGESGRRKRGKGKNSRSTFKPARKSEPSRAVLKKKKKRVEGEQ